MLWTLRLEDGQFFLLGDGAEAARRSRERAPIGGTAPEPDAAYSGRKFADWATRYDRDVRMDRGEHSVVLAPLLAIGREIAAWLDEHQWMPQLLGGAGDIQLDIEAGEGSPDQARAFLNVPWELLATAGGFLAEDPVRLYCVQRRLGRAAAAPLAPRHQRLALMFMAASPVDTHPILDFEAEEAAILKATDKLKVALTVEESGCLEFLGPRLADEGPFEALHLSCHGDIGRDGPMLVLESPEGREAPASAADIASAFGADRPGLVFLAACRTAEHETQSAPLATELLRAGVPTVLGWDGSVLDTDATRFARDFYADLANHRTPAHAAAKARQALLKAHLADDNRKTCRHWHMARLYAGAVGGGALTARDGAARPSHRGAAYNAFLDKEHSQVPVAGPLAFVGRRREAQGILRVFGAAQPKHAIGGQGKSSLAARIADRMPRHRTVVIFRDCDAHAIFGKLLSAVPLEDREPLREHWEKHKDKGDTLADVLEKILTGSCAAHDPVRDRSPLLLIIDDLERALQNPAPGASVTPVRPLYQPPLGAVLGAFDRALRAGSQSRLLITSRYDFALTDRNGVDLARLLHKMALRPFDANEQGKQQRAAQTELDGAHAAALPADALDGLLARARAASLGNPLIQATLTRLALAQPNAAEPAIREMEAYIASGKTRDHAQLAALFERLTLDAYRTALSADEARAFRAMRLFEVPVPEAALVAAAEAFAPSAARAAFQRFLRLGLIDPFESAPPAITEFLASKLARPLFPALTEDEQRRLAEAALPPLIAAWASETDRLPFDVRALETYRLARLVNDATNLAKAALSGGAWLSHELHDDRAALALIEPALRALAQAGIQPDPLLLKLAIECAVPLRETTLLTECLRQASELTGLDLRSEGLLLLLRINSLIWLNKTHEAQQLIEKAKVAFKTADDPRHFAMAVGKSADIFESRGDFDEAFRIRCEEELPVYERLSDIDALGATHLKLARNRRDKGASNQESSDRILDHLRRAYSFAKVCTRLRPICDTAEDLGKFLAMVGAQDEARFLLTEARDGRLRLGQIQHVAEIDAFLARL